jgi:hypothetical protein
MCSRAESDALAIEMPRAATVDLEVDEGGEVDVAVHAICQYKT